MDWLQAQDVANDRQEAEQQVKQLVELNFIDSEGSESQNDSDPEQENQEWLHWIPEKPERRGTALNMLYRWQGTPRAASEVGFHTFWLILLALKGLYSLT